MRGSRFDICDAFHASDRQSLTLLEAIQQSTARLTQAGVNNARLDAELLLSHTLRKDRTWLFTHIHEALGAEVARLFQELIERRAGREPLQYIIGSQEFWGLEFKVTPDVLIPRPETELIVESAISLLRQTARPMIADACTGSGCIAISLAKALPAAGVIASDKSKKALSIAAENADRHGVADRIRFLEGDLFKPLIELDLHEKVDIITANPPYIPSGDLPGLQPEVRDFEPEMALIAGKEGVEIHKRIIVDAARYLKKRGSLIMEMGIGQADSLSTMADGSQAYFKAEILQDLAEIDRVIILQRK